MQEERALTSSASSSLNVPFHPQKSTFPGHGVLSQFVCELKFAQFIITNSTLLSTTSLLPSLYLCPLL